ncbi:class I SAM-dependent methyltransferase [Streptomyces sp. NBC_01217]|nr:class I SAM-dependent methyltransferase [Streptomyces sp. NBC_01217]
MREWRDATVRRIRELRPRRVLEIGVGTGLLLSQLAPGCEEYWGTDISVRAVDTLRHETAARPGLDGRVQLSHRAAHDVGNLPPAHFDVVVLNSVLQYFSDGDYLLDVLSKAWNLLRPGGTLFAGDVRDARSLRCFSSAAVLRRASARDDRARLRQAVERALALEAELLVAPDFFHAFARREDGGRGGRPGAPRPPPQRDDPVPLRRRAAQGGHTGHPCCSGPRPAALVRGRGVRGPTRLPAARAAPRVAEGGRRAEPTDSPGSRGRAGLRPRGGRRRGPRPAGASTARGRSGGGVRPRQ